MVGIVRRLRSCGVGSDGCDVNVLERDGWVVLVRWFGWMV